MEESAGEETLLRDETPNGDQTPTPESAKRNDNQEDDNSSDEEINRVITQLQDVYKAQGNIWETFFYRIVLAGNVDVVKKTLEKLKNSGCDKELGWLLKTSARAGLTHQVTSQLRIVRVLMFLILALVNILLTPVFYAFHMMATAFFTRTKKRLTVNVRLPLAYAAFCCDPQMIQVFTSNGVDIEQVDDQNNNVFHYIGDISATSPEKSIEMFEIMVKFINNEEEVENLICRSLNSAGLSALAYIGKFGSLALLTEMLNHPSVLLHCELAAGKKQLSFDEDKDVSGREFTSKLEYVDVTMFEDGRLAKQSAILRLVSGRDVTKMSLADNALYNQKAFVGKWMNLKCKQMMGGIATLHLLDVIVTILLVINITYINRALKFRQRGSNKYTAITLEEISQFRDRDMQSSIVTNDALQRVIQEQKYDEERYLLTILNGTHPEGILAVINQTGSELNLNNPEFVHHVLDIAVRMSQFKGYYCELKLWNNLDKIMLDFATLLFKEHPHLLEYTSDYSSSNLVLEEMGNVYATFNVTSGNCSLEPRKIVSLSMFTMYYSPRMTMLNSSDFHPHMYDQTIMDTQPQLEDIIFDIWSYKLYHNLLFKDCKYKEHGNGDTWSLLNVHVDSSLGSKFILLDYVSLWISVIYLTVDLLERFVFIYGCICSQSNALQMLNTFLTQKVPGSCGRKQLNILTFLLMLFYAKIGRYLAVNLELSFNEIISIMSYCLIGIMILRFMMHIHSMRLLPGIGHFVITTFMMGTNLMHFSAIYGIVTFVFSVIFYIIFDDQKCPLKKHEDFETILTSMFSIFKLTFGHGDFDIYYTSSPVKLTYAIFVILSGLLFMNLIIAIMSTTATNVMSDPWRDTLFRIEWLEEALSVEHTASVLFAPVSHLWQRQLGFWFHKKAGYVVKQGVKERDEVKENKYKIYIRVSRCSVLDN